ncbi:tripartite tricarboxylate transporter TctB family protein [Rothia koreensis]|uniref:tripartite tricarboxylate transporter TctB family protein n=1 Tax=Rothia koreensis TaxID=592378 RepID=UPI003F2474D4
MSNSSVHHPYPPSRDNYAIGPRPPKSRNVLGVVALVAAVVGFVFACIPGALIVGWILLPIAFILGIVSLFLTGKGKWPGLTAIIVSIVGTVIGFVVFIGVVGSSIDDAIHDNDGKASNADSSSSSADSSASTSDRKKDNPHFGQKYEWDSGISVTVSEPEQFQPSETAANVQDIDPNDPNVRKFTVTLHNGTDKPLDAVTAHETVLSGGKEASFFADTENGIDGMASGKIQPGKDLTYDIAYALADPNDLSMDFSIYDDSYKNYEVTYIQ